MYVYIHVCGCTGILETQRLSTVYYIPSFCVRPTGKMATTLHVNRPEERIKVRAATAIKCQPTIVVQYTEQNEANLPNVTPFKLDDDDDEEGI